MTDRALAFFEKLVNSITLEVKAPDFDQWVDEVRHAREEIAAARATGVAPMSVVS